MSELFPQKFTTVLSRSQSLIDSVESDYAMLGDTFDVFFAPNGHADFVGYISYTSEGWNSYEKQQVQLALEIIEAVVDVTFNIVNSPSGAEFVILNDRNELATDTLGIFELPNGSAAQSAGIFNGDWWDRSAGGDLEVGGYSFATFVHEFLHGLGLGHPHDTGGGTTIMSGVTSAFDDYGIYNFNQGIYTAMTYNSGFNEGDVGTAGQSLSSGGNWGYEAGPMALDIAALQDLYGVNETHASGADTYLMPDQNQSGTSWSSIWDTGGTDRIRYIGSKDTVIDLRAASLDEEEGGLGWVSAANGVAGGYTIANGVIIEEAQSGSGNDLIMGNTTHNWLSSGGGADTIEGFGGRDTLEGGSGNDRLKGGAGSDLVKGGVNNDNIQGNGGDDKLNGGDDNDSVYAGTGSDTLYGEAGSDKLFGQIGRDLIKGGAGIDTVNGGGGNDTLEGGTGADYAVGGAGKDIIRGNGGNDDLYGSSGGDAIFGGAGADELNGGKGNDTLNGGTGADTIIFEAASGNDRVKSFQDNIDTLMIDAALWGTASTAQELVDTYADDSGSNVIFEFHSGELLTIVDFAFADALADDILML